MERGARSRRTRGGFRTKGEARAALERELRSDRLGPELARELYPESVTFDQLADSYIDQHPLQASSKKTLAERLRYARDTWGDTDIRHITVVEVKAWRAGLPKGSAQGIHQALKQTLRFAVDAGLLAENPASKVRNPAARRDEIKPFDSWQQVDAVAQELDPRYRAIPIVAAGTGLRPQEWIALERSDIERGESPVVHVRRTFTNGVLKRYGKTERSLRRVPLRGVVLEALEAMPTRVDTALLFPGARGGHLNHRNFRNRDWKPAVRSVGLESQTIYSMRHSYASWSISAGESLFALARFMGTSVKMIDQTYGHLAEDAEAQNLSLLNSWDGRALGARPNEQAEM